MTAPPVVWGRLPQEGRRVCHSLITLLIWPVVWCIKSIKAGGRGPRLPQEARRVGREVPRRRLSPGARLSLSAHLP
jgi:hypothetical protein